MNPPSGDSFEVVVSTDERNLSRLSLPSDTPEARSFFLFPVFRRRLELFLDEFSSERPPRRRMELKFDLDAEQLRTLRTGIRMPPLEKIQTFVFIANQNIFADPDVPLSLRLVSAETGVPPELARRLIGGNPSGELELVQNNFVQVRSPLDL
ncbi:MAG: hypothetical protein KGJ84_04930 [Elusimicrobia bacterium]|nr:hypothetical protein [Elusimicrobiota bacterium]